MKKIYKISRIIVTIITFIIFNIMFINDMDMEWIILSLIFTLVAFGASFPGSVISKKIIDKGNSIQNYTLKVLFYMIGLPIIIFLLFLVILFVVGVFIAFLTPINEYVSLENGVLGIFIVTIGTICVIVPYVQSLIVLILKKFIKK